MRLPSRQLRRIAQRLSSLRTGRQVCSAAVSVAFVAAPVQGAVPLNSYCYSPRVSTLQVRVLTRYLRVIFASRCGNLRGQARPRTARRSAGGGAANRAAAVEVAQRAKRRTDEPPASDTREHANPAARPPIFTRRSCFFKASFRTRTYYMNRSLSLPFTDRALPSAIRPGGFSHSRLARGARDSHPRPADSHGAVFPSAPLRRPASHPGAAKPIAGSPSPHRRGPPRLPTAAVLRLGGKMVGQPAAR